MLTDATRDHRLERRAQRCQRDQLQHRALRYYPSNLGLSVVQGIVQGSVWYFIARFLSGAADAKVAAYGGSYVAYVVMGVAFFQAGTAALNGPFEAIGTAFWARPYSWRRRSA